MKRILLCCATGVATSTVVHKRVEEELKRRGYNGQFTITQCKVAEVPGQSPNYDLCVSTVAMDAKNCACPIVIATNLIINRGTEPIYNEIENKLFKEETAE